ncbi:PA14 domain-containing protein [Aestuariivita boseongensis]|uniref:PA14 domain-containing protein n=1 Tax=Aestuariivita boseongensis TaxID=1470562 RepID=UPI0009E1AF76
MKLVKIVSLCAAIFSAGAALAGPLKLEPANPQPSGLKSGLAVKYALPEKQIKTLAQADEALKSAKRGPALKGLDYWDTEEGGETLTSGKAWWVAAQINGYVRFDAPGVYTIDFLVNDGLRMFIGGKKITVWDQRTPCEPIPAVEVEVPVAGWYPLSAVYFQNQGTACLHMRAAPKGSAPDWMPDAAFGH